MADTTFDERVAQLQEELARFTRIANHLGVDVVRPLRAFADGYPENTVLLVGKITERLLKELWVTSGVDGDPANRSLSELIKGTRDAIHSGAVLDALRDIQQRRNKSSHDGYDVADEDALFVLRRLVVVLEWFTSTSIAPVDGPALDPLVEEQLTFLIGLYLTLGYRVLRRFELTNATAYVLLERARGLRLDYVEILLSSKTTELLLAMEKSEGELLKTTLRKRTRFVVVENDDDVVPIEIARGSNVVTFDHFVDSIVDSEALRDAAAERLPADAADGIAGVGAELLTIDPKTLRFRIDAASDPTVAVEQAVRSGGNLLIVGPGGSGKSTLLRMVAARQLAPAAARYRFHIDLGLRGPGESFADVVSSQLDHAFRVERHEIYETFLYLIRSGKAVCLIDAIDEGVASAGVAGLLELFAEISETISAESTTILASRSSFLLESPYVRQLLHHGALASELLTTGLAQEGVDPLELPDFSVLKVGPRAHGGAGADPLLLERSLTAVLEARAGPLRHGDLGLCRLALQVVDADIADSGGAKAARVDSVLGSAILERTPTFAVTDLFNAFGIGAFEDGVLDVGHLRPRLLFEAVGPDRVRFRHRALGEAVAARLLARRVLGADVSVPERDVIPDQTRRFLHEILSAPGDFGLPTTDAGIADDSCIVRPGAYVIGPPDHSWLHRQHTAFEVDRSPVTVREYREFLDALVEGEVELPDDDRPAGHDCNPFLDRVRIRGYFEQEEYEAFPAMCIDWWSAAAYAHWRGKRLPTSIEWELAARGRDGRLFPWGDDAVLGRANSADHSCGRLLVSYEEWKVEFDSGGLREGLPMAVGSFPDGASPCGALDMAGNVWEWTATTVDQPDGVAAVIAGGSFDNPLGALRCFSRGLYHLTGRSNAVGFRCVRDIDG